MGLFSFMAGNGNGRVDPSRRDSPRTPGPSRGLLSRFRGLFGGWPGPEAGERTPGGVYLREEKAAAGPRGITFPWFLPYHDADHAGETNVMRHDYRRMFGSDPNVRSAILGKLLAVSALKLTVQAADKKNAFDRYVADFVDWNLNQRFAGCMPALVWAVLSGALVDGYSVSEKVWTHEDKGQWGGKWPLRDLKPKDTGNDLILQTDEFRNITGIFGLRYNGGKEFSPADFLIYRHLPLFDSPTGASDCRAVYSRWWMLDTLLKLLAIGVEKRAYPQLVGYWKSATEQPGLEGMLARAKWQNWISAPDTCKVEALNAAGAGNAEISAIIKDLKHDIYLGIRLAVLQNLEGTTSDARGNSQVHQSEAEQFVWYIAETVTSLLNGRDDGLIKDIVDLNFVVSEYPRATLGAVDVNEQTQRLAIFVGLHGMGLDLSKEQLYEEFDAKAPEVKGPQDEDDRLAGGSAPAGGPPGPSGGPPGGPGGKPGELPFKEVETRHYDRFAEEFAEGNFFGWGSLSEHEWENFDDSEWVSEPGPRSKNRWRNERTGRIVYSPTNPGAARTARTQTAPSSPRASVAKPGSANKAAAREVAAKTREKGKAEATKAQAGLVDLVKELSADPSKITPEHVKTIGAALPSLSAAELKALKTHLSLKGGGATKAAMVKTITDRALSAPVRAAGTAAKKPAVKPAARPPSGPLGDAIGKGLDGSSLSPKSRTAFESAGRNVLARMPDKLHELLAGTVGQVSFHESPEHLVKELAQNPVFGSMFKNLREGIGVQGQYIPAATGKNGKSAVAVARASAGKEPNTGKYDSRTGNVNEGTLAHELAHGLDKDYVHSTSPEWKEAFAKEIEPIDNKIKSGYRLSHYATDSKAEGFAEFGRLLYGSKVPHAKIEKDFPLASAYFKAKGLWPNARGDSLGEFWEDASEPALRELFSGRLALPGGRGSHVDLAIEGNS